MTSWPKVSERRKVISGCGGDDGGFWGVVVDGEDFSVRSSRLCKMFRSEGISMWYCRSADCEIVICDMRYAMRDAEGVEMQSKVDQVCRNFEWRAK